MKSDVSRPAEHTMMAPHKTNHPSKLGGSGTNEHASPKSHEQDIEWGEGINDGMLHPAHERHVVREAKEVGSGSTKAARNAHMAHENGSADTSK